MSLLKKILLGFYLFSSTTVLSVCHEPKCRGLLLSEKLENEAQLMNDKRYDFVIYSSNVKNAPRSAGFKNPVIIKQGHEVISDGTQSVFGLDAMKNIYDMFNVRRDGDVVDSMNQCTVFYVEAGLKGSLFLRDNGKPTLLQHELQKRGYIGEDTLITVVGESLSSESVLSNLEDAIKFGYTSLVSNHDAKSTGLVGDLTMNSNKDIVPISNKIDINNRINALREKLRYLIGLFKGDNTDGENDNQLFDRLNNEIDTIDSNIKTCEIEKDQESKGKDEADKASIKLKQTVQDVENSLNSLRDSITTIENQIEELIKHRETTGKIFVDIHKDQKEKIDSLEETIQQTKEDMNDLAIKFGEHQGEMDEERTKLEGEIEQQEEEKTKEEDSFKDAESEQEKLRERSKTLKESIRTADHQIEETNSHLASRRRR